MSQREHDGGDSEHSQVVDCPFLVAGGKAAELLQAIDQPVHYIPLAVGGLVESDPSLPLLASWLQPGSSSSRRRRCRSDWSHSLLEEGEQTLLARLLVFAGGCAFEAAEAVCNPDGDLDLLEGLTSLVEWSRPSRPRRRR